MYGFEAFVEGWQKYVFKWDGMGRLFRRKAHRSYLFWPTFIPYADAVILLVFVMLVSKNHMTAVFYVF